MCEGAPRDRRSRGDQRADRSRPQPAATGCREWRTSPRRHRLGAGAARRGGGARADGPRPQPRRMRVDPNPLLAVGMKLRLVVHAETRETPLILHAVVDRDDGERGLVLRFCDLSAELTRYLDYVIHALPLVIDDDDDEGCLITELLEASYLTPACASVTTIRTLVRVVRRPRCGRERDDVGARVARSGRPSQDARAVAATVNTAPRAASGVPSANAAESAIGPPAGSRPAPRSAAGAPRPRCDWLPDRAREARSPRSSSRRRDRPPRPRACRRSRDCAGRPVAVSRCTGHAPVWAWSSQK